MTLNLYSMTCVDTRIMYIIRVLIHLCVSYRRRPHSSWQPEKAASRQLRFFSTTIPTVTSPITWIVCPVTPPKSGCIMTSFACWTSTTWFTVHTTGPTTWVEGTRLCVVPMERASSAWGPGHRERRAGGAGAERRWEVLAGSPRSWRTWRRREGRSLWEARGRVWLREEELGEVQREEGVRMASKQQEDFQRAPSPCHPSTHWNRHTRTQATCPAPSPQQQTLLPSWAAPHPDPCCPPSATCWGSSRAGWAWPSTATAATCSASYRTRWADLTQAWASTTVRVRCWRPWMSPWAESSCRRLSPSRWWLPEEARRWWSSLSQGRYKSHNPRCRTRVRLGPSRHQATSTAARGWCTRCLSRWAWRADSPTPCSIRTTWATEGSRASPDRCPPIRPCRALWINTPRPPPSTATPPPVPRVPLPATLPTRPASTRISPLHRSPRTLGRPLRRTPTQTGLTSPPAPPLWGTPTTHCRHPATHTFQSRCSRSRSRSRCSRPLNSPSSETCRCLRRPAERKAQRDGL